MRIFLNLILLNILCITTTFAILSKEEDEAKEMEEDESVDLDSGPKGGFFDLLSPDELPFQKRTFSIDFLNHKLEYALLEPINGECALEIEIFVFVPTRTDSFYTRRKIRESWAANLTDEKIALKFIVGWPLEEEDIFNLLLDEFTQFDDLIIYDIEDNYANLYLKVFVALQWQQFYCSNAQFVLKTDDDTCVDLSRLRWWISNEFAHRVKQYPASVFGGIWRGTKAIRSPTHKWYVPSSLYPKSKYPAYMNGPTYLMSSNAVSAILNVTQSVKAFTIEDILYTGILANIAHVKKFSVWQHFRQGKFIYIREHCQADKLNGNRPIPFVTAIYGISDPDKLQRAFNRLRNIDCSPWSSMRRILWTSLFHSSTFTY